MSIREAHGEMVWENHVDGLLHVCVVLDQVDLKLRKGRLIVATPERQREAARGGACMTWFSMVGFGTVRGRHVARRSHQQNLRRRQA